jgi:hypothetical protein
VFAWQQHRQKCRSIFRKCFFRKQKKKKLFKDNLGGQDLLNFLETVDFSCFSLLAGTVFAIFINIFAKKIDENIGSFFAQNASEKVGS